MIRNTFQNVYPAPPEVGQRFFGLMVEIAILKTGWERTQQFKHFKFPRPGSEKLGVDFSSFWDAFMVAEPSGSQYGQELLKELFHERSQGSFHRATDNFESMMYEIELTNGWRRLFRTSNSLLGVGARSLRDSDELWVLAGFKTPAILRRRLNGRYQFIGQAYVHGMMHGEAVNLGLHARAITLE